jgi:PAS domain S-box-containing protein
MHKIPTPASKGNILVVDDTPLNVRLLTIILDKQGYLTHSVSNGEAAIAFVATHLPELILLDIMMPGMDGYTVCEKLKLNERTRDIPIIFISALSDVVDKIKAFSVGGVDFITKPFQLEEVLARVETHLTLRRLQQSLQEKNQQLQQEIAERKLVEQALRESEETFRLLFKNSPLGYLLYELHRLIDCNDVVLNLFACSDKQLMLKQHPAELSPEYQPDGQLSKAKAEKVNEIVWTTGFCRFEWLHRKFNGELFLAEVTLTKVTLRGTPTILVVWYDLTERKQAEEKLKTANEELSEQKTKLQATLEHLQATQRELIQAEKMVALGQLVAGVAHEVNTPLGAIRSSVENISGFLKNNLEQLPNFFRNLSDTQQESFFLLFHQSMKQQHISLSSKEKRQRRRAISQILETYLLDNAEIIADKLVEIGCYDNIETLLPFLQQPSNAAILDMAYQIISLQRSTRTIATAAERAAKVVFALKNFARYDHRSEKVLADVVEGIETVLTLYHNQLKQGIEVIKNFAAVPPIFCFPDELNQVWTNLIHNAIQAMNNKGVLQIEVVQQEKFMIISIIDSGMGIPQDIIERIFEPFFTTKPAGEGSGLGLDIVRKIIDKHDGKIAVESCTGKTVFNVHLPLITSLNQ